jgi:hypothetical protein
MDKRIAQFILDPAGRLRLIPLSCCVVLAAAIFATSAGAFDRAPIPVGGLYADGWGQSTTTAERGLYRRYPGIRSVYCVGVLIRGD